MPIVRPYPIGEVSPQPLPTAQLDVPAASEAALFGGNQARDLQLAGQQLGQTSDSLFALYERKAKEANDDRVQDLNNQFITGNREILRTGPDAYYKQTGADAMAAAAKATDRLRTLKDQLLGQTANDYQRRALGRILDAHLVLSADDIARHADEQQAVYGRNVAATAIATSQADALANPGNLPHAMARAEGAARVLYRGQVPEVVESEVRKAGASIVSAVIADRLSRNDPSGMALLRRYGDRLDPSGRRRLGVAAEALSNTLAAETWLRDRSAALRTPTPTGDAVNAASAPTSAVPSVVSSAAGLLDQEGVTDTRERLDEIDERHRALTALNQQEFATDPRRLRANQAAIDADTARSRAVVKAESDALYADLRRHLTTGGPSGGPAVTLPSVTIMSRLTDAQQDAVTAQVAAAIEGRRPNTDAQTWYAIRRGLTGGDANERQRWAAKNLVPFMGRLSEEDFAALEHLQTAVRTNDGGAEQNRLRSFTRIANRALQSAGIDPTPRADAAPDSDAAQAARFHRALQDELSAFGESKGQKPTEADGYDIVNRLKDTAIKSGWLKVNDRSSSLTDDAFHEGGPPPAEAEPSVEAEQSQRMGIGINFDEMKRLSDEDQQREPDEQMVVGAGGANAAPATESSRHNPGYRMTDTQVHQIAPEQTTGPSTGKPAHQAVNDARQLAERREADERQADRMTTRWLAQEREERSSPNLPPALSERLSPVERKELESLAATPNTQTDPEVYNRILSNLLNYNSQVRLKWAREPLFRYRKSLSAEDFAKVARLQARLDPETGQVSGFAPTPTDLVPFYDWLAPEPDWNYGTFIATQRTSNGSDWRFVLPPPVRSFFKGMLDLFAAEKTGDLTTDALESLMTLHNAAGSAFGPRGGEGVLAAGGKRPKGNSSIVWFGPRTQPPNAEEIAENERIARLIAGGHASLKHFKEKFPDMRNLDDYARHIADVMTNWSEKKYFKDSGKTLYWHGPSGTAVWRNPLAPDGGTAFRPENGKKYFDGQKMR